MTAKEYLRQLKLLDIKIQQRIKEKEELRLDAYGTGGSMPDSERVQTSPSGDGLLNSVARYVDIEADINRMISEFVTQKHKIIGEIQRLEDERYVQVLYKRYAEFKTYEKIAVEMNYTYEHICRLHGWALKEFARCYEMSY